MAYIEGQTLTQWARQREPTARQAAEMVAALAHAVSYAHTQGLLHRDIKPGNVMVDATTGQPVLTDFGLAQELACQSSELTHTGQVWEHPPTWLRNRRPGVATASERTPTPMRYSPHRLRDLTRCDTVQEFFGATGGGGDWPACDLTRSFLCRAYDMQGDRQQALTQSHFFGNSNWMLPIATPLRGASPAIRVST
jgi:serine/threonine protein kinase